MKKFNIYFAYGIIILIVIILFSSAFIPQQPTKECGTERWQVKTLRDAESKKIDWVTKPSTVKALTQLIQPFPIKDKKFDKSIRFGYEFNVYEIKCKIREFRKEDDGDYHLVLMDVNDTTVTMVGEILNPECSELSESSMLPAYQIVREQFEKFKLPNHQVEWGTYTITGVCFFDFLHGQLGCAPNGVEIHL